VDIAARGLHEKLLRRLAAWRSSWPDEAFFGAVTGSFLDLGAGYGGAQPVAAVALAVGRRVVAVASPGTRLCLISGATAAAAVASASVEAGGATTCFEELGAGDGDGGGGDAGIAPSALHIALAAGETRLDDAAMVAAVAPQLYQGHPRAASAALLRAARGRGAPGPLAAACARFGPPRRAAAAAKPVVAEATGPRKMRVSQILLRHWRGEGAKPVDPVHRRPVSRTAEEAELQLLGVLDDLAADGCAGWSRACKAVSECQSSLKGGELAGDLGWLTQAKDAALAQAKGQPGEPKSAVKAAVPLPVLKAAFELEVGELSDLVPSDIGLHLLLRTA